MFERKAGVITLDNCQDLSMGNGQQYGFASVWSLFSAEILHCEADSINAIGSKYRFFVSNNFVHIL